MARWRLTAKHYLPVPGTEWEYKEIDDQGKSRRKVHTVPLYLDPDDPGDWTDRPNQSIIVTNVENSAEYPRDIYFLGDPTPDMEPLDAEAEAISLALRQKWEHPIESLPANGGMNESEKTFMETMMKAFASHAPQAVSSTGVDPKAFAEMQTQLASLAAQNAALLSKLEAAAPTDTARRL